MPPFFMGGNDIGTDKNHASVRQRIGFPGLIRHTGKFNTGKVILFFLLIGIITAILLAGICIATF